MAAISENSQCDPHRFSPMAQPQSDTRTGEYQLTAGVISRCITRTYTGMGHLEKDAVAIFEALEANEFSGNQWILVLGLTKQAIERLDNDRGCLGGVNFRFQWEGTAGLIKVIPSFAHEATTNDFVLMANDALAAMGIPRSDRRWGMATTYRPTVGNKGKQADQMFIPPSRQPAQGQVIGWPTLIIETGVSESLTKLQEDAKWWFHNSSGRVRIVILISIKKTKVTFEKWQLVPPNAPNPITRQYIAGLCQQSPHMPSFTTQPAATQRLYSAQEVTVTPNGVVGAPMILPFQALYDRSPGPTETDITITAQDFQQVTETVF